MSCRCLPMVQPLLRDRYGSGRGRSRRGATREARVNRLSRGVGASRTAFGTRTTATAPATPSPRGPTPMSQPPGTPDPNDPAAGGAGRDPWASPSSEQPPPPPYTEPTAAPQQPAYGQQPYPQQPYGYGPQPGYGYGQAGLYGYGAPPRTNGKATAALWTGIGSIVLTLCCGLGILGV